ncbi:MAG TPA: DICT sensory domain-containing protein [Nitrososphaeraceae archaeon]|jgi:diguanylate cyclase/two-component system sensory protein|nr:DICT sensory domain-containing protein [Nitrososphaeraceae archaeon]
MSKDYNSISMNGSPFTQLISDFKGKNIPDEQIQADYNNTLNYPNNYFVAPNSWHECFYTTSRENMLLLSKGLENILRIKPPFNKFILLSLFQRKSNFDYVAEQYATIFPLSKKTYLIGEKELAKEINLSNVEVIDFTNTGLEKNWVVIAIANDEGCALIAEEFKPGRYRGFFTTNRNLTYRCLNIIKELLNIDIEI